MSQISKASPVKPESAKKENQSVESSLPQFIEDFQQCSGSSSSTMQIKQFPSSRKKAEELIGLITHQIESDISSSKVELSTEQIPFTEDARHKTSKSRRKTITKEDEKKIVQIVKKRRELEEEMRRLKMEHEEQKVRLKKKETMSSSQQSSRTFRSFYTASEHQQISRIQRETLEFEESLKSRNKQLADRLQKERKKQMQEHQKFLEKLKEKKREESQKKIQNLKQIQSERASKIKNQNKEFQKVKKEKFYHEKIEQFQKQIAQLRKVKEQEILQTKRKKMRVDFEQIKKYSQAYYDAVKKEKEELERKKQLRLQALREQERQAHHKPSQFLQTVFMQQKRHQQEEKARIQQYKNLFARRKSYQQKLRNSHKDQIKVKPLIREKTQQQKRAQERRLKAKALSAVDIYRLGQENMQQIHSKITPFNIEQSKIELKDSLEKLRSKSSKRSYPDYLKESKIKRHMSQGKMVQSEKNPSSHSNTNPEWGVAQMTELKRVLNKKQERKEKLYKAKLIAERLDQKAGIGNTKSMVSSIAAKLRIIEEFS